MAYMCISSYNYVSFQLKKWTRTCHAKQWPTPPSEYRSAHVEADCHAITIYFISAVANAQGSYADAYK
jgi:hypothetical protein